MRKKILDWMFRTHAKRGLVYMNWWCYLSKHNYPFILRRACVHLMYANVDGLMVISALYPAGC